MINFIQRIANFFNPDQSKFTEGTCTAQAVYYVSGEDTHVNLKATVELIFLDRYGNLYGTTVINGVIRFCIHLTGGAWRVLSPEESQTLEQLLKLKRNHA